MRCPVCDSTPLNVSREPQRPDRIACGQCGAAFEVEMSGPRIRMMRIPQIFHAHLANRWVPITEVQTIVRQYIRRLRETESHQPAPPLASVTLPAEPPVDGLGQPASPDDRPTAPQNGAQPEAAPAPGRQDFFSDFDEEALALVDDLDGLSAASPADDDLVAPRPPAASPHGLEVTAAAEPPPPEAAGVDLPGPDEAAPPPADSETGTAVAEAAVETALPAEAEAGADDKAAAPKKKRPPARKSQSADKRTAARKTSTGRKTGTHRKKASPEEPGAGTRAAPEVAAAPPAAAPPPAAPPARQPPPGYHKPAPPSVAPEVMTNALTLYALGNTPAQVRAILERANSLTAEQMHVVMEQIDAVARERARRERGTWIVVAVTALAVVAMVALVIVVFVTAQSPP